MCPANDRFVIGWPEGQATADAQASTLRRVCAFLGDSVVGALGALIGGFLLRTFGVSSGGGLIGSIVVATIRAVVFIFLLPLFKRAECAY